MLLYGVVKLVGGDFDWCQRVAEVRKIVQAQFARVGNDVSACVFALHNVLLRHLEVG